MITTKRWLLTTSSKAVLEELKKFEAVKEVSNLSERQGVWNLNKTPVFSHPNEQSRTGLCTRSVRNSV